MKVDATKLASKVESSTQTSKVSTFEFEIDLEGDCFAAVLKMESIKVDFGRGRPVSRFLKIEL